MNKQHLLNRLARAGTLATLALAITLGPAAHPAPVAAKGSFYFDFEKDLKPWVAAGHGPDSYQSLDRRQGDSACSSTNHLPVSQHAVLTGGKVAQTRADSQESMIPLPTGTWMGANFLAAPGPHRVTITLHARSESNCEGCQPLVYARSEPPYHINQFEELFGGSSLKGSWQLYTYKATVEVLEKDPTVYVAFGWADTNAAIALDCVSIDLVPEP